MTKSLITGSEGFIGSHLSEKLDNEEVWTLDVNGTGSRHFRESIEDFDRFDEFDKIYHLAAISDPRACEKQKEKAWSVNVEGTRNLISQLGEDQELIFTSSGHVYGEGKKLKETDKRRPNNFYGMTKTVAEEIIQYYANSRGFNYTIFRLFNVFGPGQDQGFLVPDVIEKARTKGTVDVVDGRSKISPIYIEDVLQALSNDIPHDLYNLSGDCVEIKDVYRIICSKFNSSITFDKVCKERTQFCGDNSKILEYIGGVTDLEKALDQTVEAIVEEE